MRDLLFAIVMTPVLVITAYVVLWWLLVDVDDRMEDDE